MMKRILLPVLLVLLLGLCGLSLAEDRVLVPDSEWQPPDLSEATTENPELLLLKVAQEELGYTEEHSGYTKYGDWFGTPYCQWCSEFITWCVNEVDTRYGTELMDNLYPYYGKPKEGAPFFIKHGRFVSSNGTLPSASKSKQWWAETGEYLQNNEYIPYPGDYMWLYVPGFNNNETSHVALVEGVSLTEDGDVTIHVIEGNMPDKVQRATYLLSDYHIYGFGTPVRRVETECRLTNHRDDVVTAKTWLKALGYYTKENMTDEFTEALKKSVIKFQKANGLKAGGTLNKDTWQALQAAAAALETTETQE